MRLAIVGLGWAGQRQIAALDELNGEIDLVCGVDTDPEHMAIVARERGIEDVRSDLGSVLRDPHIDAVSLCTPHGLHADMAIEAARAGKHVLVEKPMALTVEAASSMIEAAEVSRVRLYVAESATYQPIAGYLRDIVQTRRHIGDLVAVTVTAGFRAPDYGYPARRAWLARPDLGGTGTWMLHGIHTVAQLRHIFGDVSCVYAREHRSPRFQRQDIEATLSLQLTLTSGVNVHVVQSAEARLPGDLSGYTILGDRGSLRAEGDSCWLIDDEGHQIQEHIPANPRSEFAQELAAFAAYVRDGTPGPTTGFSERRSLAVVAAGYESVSSGQPVDLERRFGPL